MRETAAERVFEMVNSIRLEFDLEIAWLPPYDWIVIVVG
jgi:hypothetical protein